MTSFRQQVAVTRAAELARRGKLSEAAAVLASIEDPSVEALDLLARIRAQQKNWDEADRLWAQVQQAAAGAEGGAGGVEGMLAAAAEGRRTVAAIRARRRAARPVLPVVAAVVLVGAAVAGGVVAVGRSTEATVAQPTPAPVQPTPPPTVDTGAEERAAELARQLEALQARQRASAAAVAGQLDVIQQRVAGPGVLAQRGPSAIRVVFTEGVFAAGTDLSPAGRAALEALGRRLPGLKASVTVTGYSVVVPGGTSSGGSRTALLRARVATQELSAASGLPLTAFTLQSGDQAHPPYRTAARNRTVTVTLAP
jgi:type VI secretion system protein ImpK